MVSQDTGTKKRRVFRKETAKMRNVCTSFHLFSLRLCIGHAFEGSRYMEQKALIYRHLFFCYRDRGGWGMPFVRSVLLCACSRIQCGGMRGAKEGIAFDAEADFACIQKPEYIPCGHRDAG